MVKNKWTLWKNVIVKNGPVHYVWTDDNIIRHSRVISPLGWLDQPNNAENCIGFNVHLERYAFKPVKTKMTQEELSKGWFC